MSTKSELRGERRGRRHLWDLRKSLATTQCAVLGGPRCQWQDTARFRALWCLTVSTGERVDLTEQVRVETPTDLSLPDDTTRSLAAAQTATEAIVPPKPAANFCPSRARRNQLTRHPTHNHPRLRVQLKQHGRCNQFVGPAGLLISPTCALQSSHSNSYGSGVPPPLVLLDTTLFPG
ncbi:hypothetical protein OH76DRAFT_957612 [Lentinus brumalis]|uniref:Uncharacterized protein n=1 Tax=Lentinus brumalis TaxID=2498619 RepID=A0A371CZ11_9APHY|nr:hypothetical protein OH76DRAFT_957612 [Polyporus brumalis]